MQKSVQRLFTTPDGIQTAFPLRSRHWITHGRRYYFDGTTTGSRGDKLLTFRLNETTFFQRLDDVSARSLGTQAFGFLQYLLCLRIVNKPRNAGHRVDQRTLGKAGRGLGLLGLHVCAGHRQGLAFRDRRQGAVAIFVMLVIR